MTESFKNLDHILRDGMNDKVQKHLVEQVQEAGRRKLSHFLFLENDSEKILEQSQSAVE